MDKETKDFLMDTAMRCAYTFAEVMLGFIGVGAAISQVPWKMALSVSVVAVIACLLKQTIVYTRQHMDKRWECEEPDGSSIEKEYTEAELKKIRKKVLKAESEKGDEDEL